MIVPDINLLLYAEIDAFDVHDAACQWWEDALSGDVQVGLPSVTIFGFIRIGTNRRIFDEPLAVDDALGRVRKWLDRPTTTFLVPGTRYVELAFRLLSSLGTGANMTTDVQIAAHAMEHGAEVHSRDADFGRFDGLRWHDPLATD